MDFIVILQLLVGVAAKLMQWTADVVVYISNQQINQISADTRSKVRNVA